MIIFIINSINLNNLSFKFYIYILFTFMYFILIKSYLKTFKSTILRVTINSFTTFLHIKYLPILANEDQ